MSRALFCPADPRLFFSRGDQTDPRLGEKVSGLSVSQPDIESAIHLSLKDVLLQKPGSFVVAGYPDDEGIKINGGRPGAADAPTAIRRPLYKMTPPVLRDDLPISIVDVGDLNIAGNELGARHEIVSKLSRVALDNDGRWIGLGGGHDFGFPDANAFASWARAQGQRPLVINFDAHLDVRPADKGLSSGTPFRRLIEAHPEIDFVEIGIQSQCNSRAHVEWLESKGGKIIYFDEIESSSESLTTLIVRTMGDWLLKPRPAFISVDIDAFSSAYAPGCSQSWATGLEPREFFPCFDMLLKRLDVRGLGIYEVSPPLDQDDRTAKLAALIAHRYISSGVKA